MSGIDIWTCSLRASEPATTRGSEHRVSLLLVCGNSETALVTATYVVSKAASITCGKATNAEGYLHPFCVNNFATSGLQQVLQQLWPVVIMKALWTHDVLVCEMQVRGAHPALLLLGLLHMQRWLPNHPLDARERERPWMGVNRHSWFIVAGMCACPTQSSDARLPVLSRETSGLQVSRA